MLFSIESVFFGIHRLQFSMSPIISEDFIESYNIFDNKLWTSRIAALESTKLTNVPLKNYCCLYFSFSAISLLLSFFICIPGLGIWKSSRAIISAIF